MKKMITTLLSVMIAVAVLVGCQATPETDVVVQKDMQQMIEKGMTNSGTPAPSPSALSYGTLCAHYGVPERFQADFSDQGVKVCANIAIELPETTTLPMAHVKADKFSQEQVYTLFHALCGDTPMFIVPETLDKEHYRDAILEYQAQLAKATNEHAIEALNSMIDELTKRYETAPERMETTPSDGTLSTKDVQHEKTNAASGTQSVLEATSDPYQLQVMYSANTLPKAMRFTVYNDIDYTDTTAYSYVDEQGNTQNFVPNSGSSLSFQRNESLCRYGLDGKALSDVTALSLSGGTVPGCLLKTTPQQARQTVEKLMADTGMGDMVIDRVTLYTSKEDPWSGQNIDDKMEMMEQIGIPLPEDQPETQGYVFRLLRQVNGVKVESDHDCSMTNIEGAAIGEEWMYELLTIAVDDQGIANLFWTGPLNVTDILTTDTTIKPWCDIQSVFQKMLPIEYTAFTAYSRDLRIDITRVSLSLQRIMEKDSFTKGLLVPVWNFYGTRTFTNEEGHTVVQDDGYFPLLSVNAIDGSVIDVAQGY